MNKQLEDILNTKGNLLIQASAGTGKTTAIMHKIEQLLSDGNENLLILTFSNAGVNEIKNRIREKGYFLSDTVVSTFHSFCWNIIKENIEITQYRKIPKILDDTTANFKKYEIIRNILTSLENDISMNQELVQNLLDYTSSGFQTTPEKFFTELYDKVSDAVDVDEWLNNSLKKYSAIQPQIIYDTANLITNILKEFDKQFKEYKLNNNYIDFQDMEKTALLLLSNQAILNYYKSRFSQILVDEYQDTSPIQEKILNLLESGNTFCVGDLKQSIYGFRNATPSILQDRYNSYLNSENGNIKYLTYNYRSSENIVNFINDIFTGTNDKDGFFTEEAKLIFGRDTIPPTTDPVMIKLVNSEKNDTKLENSIEVVNIIKSLVGKEMYISKEDTIRPCRYSDILVLSSKLATTKDILVKEFQKSQIPYTISQKTNILKEPEIRSLISILKLFTFKSDLDFLNFFHKGFLGFTDQDLMSIKNQSPSKSFYDGLTKSTDPKFSFFKTLFSDIKQEDFLDRAQYLLSSVGFFGNTSMYNAPHIAVENINTFIFWMSELQAEHPDWQITDFILYVDGLNSDGIQIRGQNIDFEDAVEISTIHSVKGMDASVVILAFTDLPSLYSSPLVSFDLDLGIGIKYFDSQKAVKKDTPLKMEIDQKQKDQQDSEEKRLLYVALTRARDQLYIVGKENPKTLDRSLLGFVLSKLRDASIAKKSIFKIQETSVVC